MKEKTSSKTKAPEPKKTKYKHEGRPYKYNAKMAERIFALMEEDTYSVAEICRYVEIDNSTYYAWLKRFPEFAEGVALAQERRMAALVVEAEKSLRKKVTGYTVTEERTEGVPGKINPATGKPEAVVKKKIVSVKHIEPDTGAIIFTLTNGAPDRWKNRQNTEVTGKDGKGLFERMTDEELQSEIDELKRKLS